MNRPIIVVVIVCCFHVVCYVAMEVGENYAIPSADQDWLTSLFYIPATPRIRKEYRMLSDAERNRFHGAILKLKEDRTVKPNKLDLLSSLHARRPSRNSAHRGTGFLAWHRVYVLLVENALREQEPEVTVPYWDCTLDAVLDLPRETSLFSEDFMGNGDGHVSTGPFKEWTVQTGYLYRTVGVLHGPLADKNITHMFKQHFISNISYPLFGKDDENIFELIHNRVHHWIGGEMKSIETAADDPIFYPYHSFVSLIWEEFRTLQRQRGIDPETDWDEFYGQGRHHKYSPMGLGNLMAIDGASNVFAENIVFDARPTCTKKDVDCGTPYLYCNVTVEKCCPWTVKEYQVIKNKSLEANTTINGIIQPYIRSKLKKGFLELEEKGFVSTDIAMEYLTDNVEDMFQEIEIVKANEPDNTIETTVVDWNAVFDQAVDNDHDTGHLDNLGYESESDLVVDHEDTDHNHDHHDHSHDRPIIEGPGTLRENLSVFEQFLEEYCLIIIGSLLIFRILFAFLCKCRTDPCVCGSKKQKYHMDGIDNINFNEEANNKPVDNSNRPDNIYTVTITANGVGTCGKTTVVRFARFVSEDPNETKDSPNDSTNDLLANYMDMNHASACLEDRDKYPELYEAEPETVDDETETDDFDNSYNSIENENFDYIREAIKEAGEDYDDSPTSDLFDTYDNIMFVKDRPVACNGRIEDDDEFTKNGDRKVDDGYVGYLPGTQM